MFLIKAGTVIQVEAPKSDRWFYTTGWLPYTTKEDKLYDKHEVWDMVAVANDREDVPEWARRNIVEHDYTVIKRDNKFALVPSQSIEFLN